MSPPKTPPSPLADTLLGEFCDLLGARTGLQVRDKDRSTVARTLMARCDVLKLSPESYLQKLRIDKVDGPEWTLLMPQLTNGESYFERDKGQFALIRDTILPDIIERKRAKNEHTLRLWSAGCSTGEEVYSLAMATEAVLPPGWKATVLGTDINASALQKARRGSYGAWSFRGVEATTRDRYFQKVGENYEVVAQLRERATFGFCNLSASDWPDSGRGILDMDLIVCRNVLIYFQRAVVAGVLSRFARTLRPGGFLLTGHAELHDQNVAPLRARYFPTSVAYQKEEAGHTLGAASSPARLPVALNSNLPAKAGARPLLPPPSIRGASSAGSGGPSSARRAPAPSQQVPVPQRAITSAPVPSAQANSPAGPKTGEQWRAEAKIHADSGRYDEAVACCREAIQVAPADADAYLLWAHIAEEVGRPNEAKELLKKVIYLAPARAEAYVELAAIYEREGNATRARSMRVSALKLLRTQTATGAAAGNSRAAQTEGLLCHVQTLVGEGDAEIMPRQEPRRGGRR